MFQITIGSSAGLEKKKRKGSTVLCCFVVIRNRMRRCKGGEQQDEKNRREDKKENTLNEKTTAGLVWDERMGSFEADEVAGTKKCRRLIQKGTFCDVWTSLNVFREEGVE